MIHSISPKLAVLTMACAASGLAAEHAKAPSNRPVKPSHSASVQEQLDIVYATYGDRQLRLDWFAPRDAARPLPTVVVVHGGGWKNGDRTRFRALSQALAARGYGTAAIEYRLATEAKFPAAIHDCNAAVRYLRAHAKRLGIDPQRIAAVGGSAGGHLVGLMAAAPRVKSLQGQGGNSEASSALQAAIIMAGPFQLADGPIAERSRNAADSNTNLWLGKTVDQDPDLYRLASPISHLSKTTPPLLFQTGEHDQPSRNLAARQRLAELGVTAELRVYRHGKHGCWNKEGWFPMMVEDIDQFLRQQLKIKSEASWAAWSEEDVRAERQGGRLLLHVDKLGDKPTISIPRLTCPIGKIHLGDSTGRELKLRPGTKRWEIALPPQSKAPLTIEIETRASALPHSLSAVISATESGVFELPAHAASTRGEMLRYEPQPHKNTLGYWVNEKDNARWTIYADQEARYRITVAQGCGKGQGGSDAEVVIGDQSIGWEVVETGHFQNFQEVAIGHVQLSSGLHEVIIRPRRKQNKAVMDVRRVRLEPSPEKK